MSDPSGQTPEAVSISPARRALWQRASFVWLIPLAALAIALGVAWQAYSSRGPLIEITFTDASGVKARETELRYRNIAVGMVEEVNFTPDLSGVVVSVRVDKDVAPYIDVATSFWIVRPELTAQGVTGLDTVLTGVYIEGAWDNAIASPQTRFRGRDVAPLFRPGQDGLQITLRSLAGGSLTDNSPITYRGIEVGRVGRAQISPEGNFAIADAIIDARHARLITRNTRFWDTSGFTFSVGPTGAQIDFSSLATLVGGGITFDTFVSGGGRVQDGTVFEVFADQAAARESLFRAPEVDTLDLRVVFDENIAGLAVGAPVELGGLRIGTVQGVSGIVDPDAFGDNRVRLSVLLGLQPARLGLQGDVSSGAALSFLQERVRSGMRARLASAGLLSSTLKIELIETEDAAPAALQVADGRVPVMPTTQSDISDAAATVEGVVTRIGDLPIEELLGSAIAFLNSAERLVSDPDLRQTPADARALLADIRAIAASDGVQRVPQALDDMLGRLAAVLSEIEAAGLAARIGSAADAATGAADALSTSLDGVPALVAQIGAVADNAASLPLDSLTEEIRDLTRSANAILGSEGARQVPETLAAVLTRFETLLADLESAQTAARLTEALQAAAAAADGVTSAAEGVPELVAQLNAVAETAAQLPLDALVQDTAALTRSAEALIGTEAARRLPDDLGAALREIGAALAELRAGGAVGNINDTLASARSAADAVAGSADALPALVARAQTVLDQASATLAGYDSGDVISRNAQRTLRDISRAAEALTSLARMLERNPGALIRGR